MMKKMKKIQTINYVEYKLGNFSILRIKNKGKQYKLYFLSIPFLFISKSTMRRIISMKNSPILLKEIFKNDHSEKMSPFFTPTESTYKRKPNDTKLISYYLPQFHPTELNNKNFGRGFTEWTNVTKAVPHFNGHHQPQLPIDVGFYDLTHDDVMYRQIELAKMYGIYGFCFYYYWFSGENPLEIPIKNWLNNKELNFPFCFCWANDNWSKLWDGGTKEIILEQKICEDDDEKFFNDILPYFKDERYIKIDNKPFFAIYRPTLFEFSEVSAQASPLKKPLTEEALRQFGKERCLLFMERLDKLAKEHGFDGIYFCCNNVDNFSQHKEWGFDALVEFPPHGMKEQKYDILPPYCNEKYSCSVIDMEDYIKNKKYFYDTDDSTVIKALFPSWDNTARKAYTNGLVFHGETPELYKQWLSDLIKWTKSNRKQDEQFVFINAWNEWAEGAHLEPDSKYGYAYLQATKEALEENSSEE